MAAHTTIPDEAVAFYAAHESCSAQLSPGTAFAEAALSGGLDGSRAAGAAQQGYPPARQRERKELTIEEEQALIEHLPMVRFLARRIHERLPQHVEIDDLVSAGVVGLMDALVKFDSARKVKFRSYAQFRIRGAILDSLRTLDWSPRDLRRKARAVQEAISTLATRLGRAPSESEIAAELGTTLEAYQQLLGELKGLEIGTLHVERYEDSGEEELAYIPGRPDQDPLFKCLKGEMVERLADAIQKLPERERVVTTLYYFEEMTMREIGLAHGVVESRISQILASAVLHLRASLSDLSSRGEPKELKGRKRVGSVRPAPNARQSQSGRRPALLSPRAILHLPIWKRARAAIIEFVGAIPLRLNPARAQALLNRIALDALQHSVRA
jgi:RNA polymerase sigma factor for flagellar operon FliA